MKLKYLIVLISGLISQIGCDSGVTPPADNPVIDSNYLAVPEIGSGNYAFTSWFNKKIYYAGPLSSFELTDSFSIVNNKRRIANLGGISFLSTVIHDHKLLLISSQYGDISMGDLYELDTATNQTQLVIDSLNISSAFPYDNDSIVFYSYGKPLGSAYGYYVMSRTSKDRRLLFSYVSELGPDEVVNGFDLDADKKILYFPLIKRNAPPKIGRYFINLGTTDTLPVTFPSTDVKYCLWLRLNSQKSQLLYSRYPKKISLEIPPTESTETGIIDLTSFDLKLIPLAPKNEKGVGVFPQWSDDDKSLSFGYAKVDNTGHVYPFSVFILKRF